MREAQLVTQADIVSVLRPLGLGAGSAVIVHSSLGSMGCVAGGAEAVVEALLETIGPTGHVMMPTFTNNVPRFDPLQEPSQSGRITEVFWRRSDVRRSWHPAHSVAVWGSRRHEFVAGHEMMAGLGIGGPMDVMAKTGAYVLLLGVDLTAC